jgi:hypothetical protein
LAELFCQLSPQPKIEKESTGTFNIQPVHKIFHEKQLPEFTRFGERKFQIANFSYLIGPSW